MSFFIDDKARATSKMCLLRYLVPDLVATVLDFTGVFVTYNAISEAFPDYGVLFLKGGPNPLKFNGNNEMNKLAFDEHYDHSKIVLIADSFRYIPHYNYWHPEDPKPEIQVFHGRKFSIQAIKDCIFLAELRWRPHTRWFGDVDSSHIFFDGLRKHVHKHECFYSGQWTRAATG